MLARQFEDNTLCSIGASRKAVPIELQALMVQTFLTYLRRDGVNGAVLFLDGLAAFPSTDRSLLFDMPDDRLDVKLAEAAFRGQGRTGSLGLPP